MPAEVPAVEALTEESALALVEAGLASESSLLMKLRQGQGLDRPLLERTKTALLFLAGFYRPRDRRAPRPRCPPPCRRHAQRTHRREAVAVMVRRHAERQHGR